MNICINIDVLASFWVYLGVKTCGVFRSFLAIVFHIVLTSQWLLCTEVAQAHYRNADVTLACERCCVTNGCLQRLVWEKKCYVFKQNRLTLLPCCILCSLPVSRQNSASSPKTLQNDLRRGQTIKNTA